MDAPALISVDDLFEVCSGIQRAVWLTVNQASRSKLQGWKGDAFTITPGEKKSVSIGGGGGQELLIPRETAIQLFQQGFLELKVPTAHDAELVDMFLNENQLTREQLRKTAV
jgi:hypothetical protein